MKEIDFIPEWYKANQNRRRSYHRQYILLAILFAMMVIWSFVIGQQVERVRADVKDIQAMFDRGEQKVSEGMQLESETASLQRQMSILDAVTPRTKMSPIVAELSWVIGDDIVLSRLSLKYETIQSAQTKDAASAGIVRIGSSAQPKNTSGVIPEPECLRITLTGIAAKGEDAAMLISRLEESRYFEQVSPVFTRAKKVKNCEVTEFEIRCYLADYKIQKTGI